MAASTSEFISTLNDLIETCKDGEEGFRQAAENVKDMNLQSLFRQYSEQRGAFARELQMMVSKLGGRAESSGSIAGAAHRGWLNLQAAITGRDEHAIINEAERGEDSAKEAYQKALAADLPADLRDIVQRQFEQVRQAHDKVRSMQLQTQRH